jgi:hypothetical protein
VTSGKKKDTFAGCACAFESRNRALRWRLILIYVTGSVLDLYHSFRNLLGLPDHIEGTLGSRSFHHQPLVVLLLCDFLFMKNDVNKPSKGISSKTLKKNIVRIVKVADYKSRMRSRIL